MVYLDTANAITALRSFPIRVNNAGTAIKRQNSGSTKMLITTETSLYDVPVISASPTSIATQSE